MVDPLSIASGVVGVSRTCVLTVKTLIDVIGKFKDAPKIIQDVSDQAKVIAISLSQLHSTFISDEHSTLAQALSTPDIRSALDIALTGCTMTLSCIESEIRSLAAKIDSDQRINLSDRAKIVWKDDRFKELLQQLHRQHSVIAILQQGFQMKVLAEMIPLLRSNQPAIRKVANDTESLRGLYPRSNGARSFLESSESANSVEPTFSIMSERQFEFDDIVTNAQAYRRVVVAATQTIKESHSRNALSDERLHGLENQKGHVQTPDTHGANQSRKLNPALSSSIVPDPPSTATGSMNFAEQLRGYADHVDFIERKMCQTLEEAEDLREMVRAKDLAIDALRSENYRLKAIESETLKQLESTTIRLHDETYGMREKLAEVEKDKKKLEEDLISSRQKFEAKRIVNLRKLSDLLGDIASLKAKAEQEESDIRTRQTTKIGRTLLVPLQPLAVLDEDSNRLPLFQAYKFPEVANGWEVAWDYVENKFVFKNVYTDERQFETPAISAQDLPGRETTPSKLPLTPETPATLTESPLSREPTTPNFPLFTLGVLDGSEGKNGPQEPATEKTGRSPLQLRRRIINGEKDDKILSRSKLETHKKSSRDKDSQ